GGDDELLGGCAQLAPGDIIKRSANIAAERGRDVALSLRFCADGWGLDRRGIEPRQHVGEGGRAHRREVDFLEQGTANAGGLAGALPAFGAGVKMGGDGEAPAFGKASGLIAQKQFVADMVTVGHGCGPSVAERSVRNLRKTWRRRDLTVPRGILSSVAMVLWDLSS